MGLYLANKLVPIDQCSQSFMWSANLLSALY